ncbi:MAG: LysR family transcriptional regulator [Rhodobacterales bacterium]|nr:MAG: LysR family transcriptional regulator [Rhodobacterales bacterium]
MQERAARLTLRAVEIFAATAREGSISGAATALGNSPATVSQQLSSLEAALGVRLMDRAARPVRLTPAGETFLRRARAILSEARLAQAELARGDLARLPRLRLGMIEDFDVDVTPRLLTDLSALLSECRFTLETGPSLHLENLLERRALDVIVAASGFDAAEGIDRFPLLEEPFAIVQPADWPVTDTLPDAPYIAVSDKQLMGRQIARHLRESAEVPPHRFALDSYRAILALVAGGEGWSILPPLGWRYGAEFASGVALLPLPGASLTRRIDLSARSDVLGDIPAQIAARLAEALDDQVIAPSCARWPWLSGRLRLLTDQDERIPL